MYIYNITTNNATWTTSNRRAQQGGHFDLAHAHPLSRKFDFHRAVPPSRRQPWLMSPSQLRARTPCLTFKFSYVTQREQTRVFFQHCKRSVNTKLNQPSCAISIFYFSAFKNKKIKITVIHSR